MNSQSFARLLVFSVVCSFVSSLVCSLARSVCGSVGGSFVVRSLVRLFSRGPVRLFGGSFVRVFCLFSRSADGGVIAKWGNRNFKRPKNREDSSDFDDFRSKLIAATQAIF